MSCITNNSLVIETSADKDAIALPSGMTSHKNLPNLDNVPSWQQSNYFHKLLPNHLP